MRFVTALFVACAALGAGVVGCGKTPTVDLASPAGNSDGSNQQPGQKPGDNTSPANGGDGSGGKGAGATPTVPPAPPPVPASATVYRFVCENPGGVQTFVSSVHAGGIGGYLYLSEAPVNTPVTIDDQNFQMIFRPVAVGYPDRDHMDILFHTKRMPNSGIATDDRIFHSRVNLMYRGGASQSVSAMPDIPDGAALLATQYRFGLRPYGGSDRGSFLVVPDGGSFKVLSSDGARRVGTIPLSPSNTYMPRIYEDRGVLAALSYQGGIFVPVFYGLKVSRGSVVASGRLNVALSGRTAMTPQLMGNGQFMWGEANGSTSVTVATFNPANQQTTRRTYQSPNGAQIGAYAAPLIDDHGQNLAVVASELMGKSSTSSKLLKVVEAKLILLRLDAGRLTKVGEVPYPTQVTNSLERRGLEGQRMAVSRIDGGGFAKDLFVALQTIYGNELFRMDSSSGFRSMSEDDCGDSSIIEEVQ